MILKVASTEPPWQVHRYEETSAAIPEDILRLCPREDELFLKLTVGPLFKGLLPVGIEIRGEARF